MSCGFLAVLNRSRGAARRQRSDTLLALRSPELTPRAEPARRHARGRPPRRARMPGKCRCPGCTPSGAHAPGSSGGRRTTARGSPHRRCAALRIRHTGTRRRNLPCLRSGCDRPPAHGHPARRGIARRGARGGAPRGVLSLCQTRRGRQRRRGGLRRRARCSRASEEHPTEGWHERGRESAPMRRTGPGGAGPAP